VWSRSHARPGQAYLREGRRVPRQQRGARIGASAQRYSRAEIRGCGAPAAAVRRDRAARGQEFPARGEDGGGAWSSSDPQCTAGDRGGEAAHEHRVARRDTRVGYPRAGVRRSDLLPVFSSADRREDRVQLRTQCSTRRVINGNTKKHTRSHLE